MILTKNRTLSFVAAFIIIAVYNVVVFVIPFSKGCGFWTGYGFSMLALLLTTAVVFYVFERKRLRSKVYGLPLIIVARSYLIIQLIVGLLMMILQFIPYKYGIAVNIVLLGAFLIGLITLEATKDEIERIDEKIKEITFFIKSLQVDIEGLVDRASDESVRKALKELSETIRYSDPMSNPKLVAVENKIEAKAVALAETVEKADINASKVLCDELQQLFAERNRKCKILK